LANDAEMIPLPNEEVTPPVTKMYLMFSDMTRMQCAKVHLRGTKVSQFGCEVLILLDKCWKVASLLLAQWTCKAFHHLVFG
jgi:hypothetical protein